MSRKYRLFLLGASLFILLIIGRIVENSWTFIINDFWFTSGLLLLVLLSLIDQPFFSKDSNIFVNAVTAALSLLLVPQNERNIIFWGFLLIIVYLVVSSYVLMWIRTKQLVEENACIQLVSRINRQIGRPEAIFSSLFLWGAVRQYSVNSPKFNGLLWFWVVFMILNIPSIASSLEAVFDKINYKDNQSAIGIIFGVQSKNTFLVKFIEKSPVSVNMFDIVEFEYSIDKMRHRGIVIDVYFLNQEKWFKILSTVEINKLFGETVTNYKADLVYKSFNPPETNYIQRFVGLITENTTIEKIRFSYVSKIEIKSGQLVEVSVGDHKVLYQVVQGIARTEQLEEKNRSEVITGEAVQLGEWNSERKRFEQFGWVPNINSPVFIASPIQPPEISDDEYIIGKIPNTEYPVIMNKELAITHHTAILGVTGVGKSVFTRNLIRQIASDEVKVIIVDLTGEYKSRFQDIGGVIESTSAQQAFNAIETIAVEKAKYPSQQDRPLIAQNEKRIKVVFFNAIKKFLEGNENKAIFELPDISNNSDVLEYTKWFFYVLFQIAKTRNSFGKRICVVLEEAHTIIPELNSMGVSDYASKATVNSISQIALQGRKYNIGFIVIAQRTANVSKTVLTQCNSIISFQELDKTSSDFLLNYMGTEYTSVLPTLKFRMAIAVGKAFRSTVPMIFEVPEIKEEIYDDGNIKDDDPFCDIIGSTDM